MCEAPDLGNSTIISSNMQYKRKHLRLLGGQATLDIIIILSYFIP